MQGKVSDNEQIAKNFFETFSAGNYPALRLMFSTDAVWTVMPSSIPGAGPHVGREGIVDDFLMVIRGTFKDGDPKLRVTNVFSKDGSVAVETHTTGVFKNGNQYDNRYCWILEIAAEKITVVREYMDSAYVASVMS